MLVRSREEFIEAYPETDHILRHAQFEFLANFQQDLLRASPDTPVKLSNGRIAGMLKCIPRTRHELNGQGLLLWPADSIRTGELCIYNVRHRKGQREFQVVDPETGCSGAIRLISQLEDLKTLDDALEIAEFEEPKPPYDPDEMVLIRGIPITIRCRCSNSWVSPDRGLAWLKIHKILDVRIPGVNAASKIVATEEEVFIRGTCPTCHDRGTQGERCAICGDTTYLTREERHAWKAERKRRISPEGTIRGVALPPTDEVVF